jgi:hypothetical protein
MIGGRLDFSGSTSQTDATAPLRKAGEIFERIFTANDQRKEKDKETARLQANDDRSFDLRSQEADRNIIQFEQKQFDDNLASKILGADINANKNIDELNSRYSNAGSMSDEQLNNLNQEAIRQANSGSFLGSEQILSNPEFTQGASGKMLLDQRNRLDLLANQENKDRAQQIRDINNQRNDDRRLKLQEDANNQSASYNNQRLELERSKSGIDKTKEVNNIQAWVSLAESKGVDIKPTDTIDTLKNKISTVDSIQKQEAVLAKEDRKLDETKRKELKDIGNNPSKYLKESANIKMDEEASSKLNSFLKRNGADTDQKKKDMLDLIKSKHETSIFPNVWDSDFEDTLDRIVSDANISQNY